MTRISNNQAVEWTKQKEGFTGLCFTAQEAKSTVELCVSGSPSIANSVMRLKTV